MEELPSDKSVPTATQFARRASGNSSSIIYTDFIADVGPIVSGLAEEGIEAVGYHGEMDSPSRLESYMKWKSSEVKVIVATKAFGMGIDKSDIRHIVVRNGVPESIPSWVQEMGRAGRDGQQSWATILFKKGDLSHANAWILNNLSNKPRCSRILTGFSDAWCYIHAHLAGVCRRKIILDAFGEEDVPKSAECCDVCSKTHTLHDYKKELKVVIDARD